MDDYLSQRTNAVLSLLTGYSTLPPEVRRAVDSVLSTLGPAEYQVLELRMGFDGKGLRTLEDVAAILGLEWDETRSREGRALSILRHPQTQWPEFDWAGIRVERKAEVLLLRVEQLVDERDALVEALSKSLEDASAARARVKDLEDVVSLLRRGLYESGPTNRRWVGYIASLAVGLLGGLAGGLGQAAGEQLLSDAHEAAVEVVVECEMPVPTAIDLPISRSRPGADKDRPSSP